MYISINKLNQIFLVSLLILLFLANNIFCSGIKKRIGVGWQCLPTTSYFYSPYSGLEQIEFMAGISDNLGIIFSISKRASQGAIKIGVQSYFTPEKKVSPYLKLDTDMLFYEGGYSKSINVGLGFHYFHNKHIGVALQSSIFRYSFDGNGSDGEIYMISGLYVWLFL